MGFWYSLELPYIEPTVFANSVIVVFGALLINELNNNLNECSMYTFLLNVNSDMQFCKQVFVRG